MTCILACGGEAKQGKEYTSAYICPMHCEGSGNDYAGTCPTCKMDYVKNENFKGEFKEAPKAAEPGHEGHDHSGHDHSNHEGHDHN